MFSWSSYNAKKRVSVEFDKCHSLGKGQRGSCHLCAICPITCIFLNFCATGCQVTAGLAMKHNLGRQEWVALKPARQYPHSGGTQPHSDPAEEQCLFSVSTRVMHRQVGAWGRFEGNPGHRVGVRSVSCLANTGMLTGSLGK